MIVCQTGCCNGCGNCYGYAIGCHQEPCRCDQPCTGWDEEADECVGECSRHHPAALGEEPTP